MHKLIIILGLLSFCASCSSESNTAITTTTKKEEIVVEKKEVETSFTSYTKGFNHLSLPAHMDPTNLKAEDLVRIEDSLSQKYIKPYTEKISESDYEYDFNYPDFSSNEYYYLGKLNLDKGVTITFFALLDNSYQFIGTIAYDKEGNIVDGLMIGESESGSQAWRTLKCQIEETEGLILINSLYTEVYAGEDEPEEEIKKQYRFNTETQKFEEVK